MRSRDWLDMVDKECFEELLRRLLGVKTNCVPRNPAGGQVVFDVEQIVFGPGEPGMVVCFRGAHRGLAPPPQWRRAASHGWGDVAALPGACKQPRLKTTAEARKPNSPGSRVPGGVAEVSISAKISRSLSGAASPRARLPDSKIRRGWKRSTIVRVTCSRIPGSVKSPLDGYLFFHTGLRFSRSARRPSCESSRANS